MIKMSKKLFVLLAVIMVLSMISIPALATPPDNAQGDWYYHPRLDELVELKNVGGNSFLHTVEDSQWSGTFHGSEDCVVPVQEDCASSVDYGKVVFHSSGNANFNAVVLFPSVTVDGQTGTLEMRVNGSSPDPVSDWIGKWVITGGELQQAGLHGQGTWWGPGWQGIPGEWGEIHYSGNIHFESE